MYNNNMNARQRVTMNFGCYESVCGVATCLRHCPAEKAHSTGRQRPGTADVLGVASATKQVAYGRAGLSLTR